MTAFSEPRVLIVEDNPGDIFLFQESLRECQVSVTLLIAHEVEEAIRILRENQGPVPHLALIDLHLPKRDGKSLLLYLRDQPQLEKMPSVILSSSQRISDRDACLELGAREVLIKPSDWKGYNVLIAKLKHYWSAEPESSKP